MGGNLLALVAWSAWQAIGILKHGQPVPLKLHRPSAVVKHEGAAVLARPIPLWGQESDPDPEGKFAALSSAFGAHFETIAAIWSNIGSGTLRNISALMGTVAPFASWASQETK
jgi:hypothetical protein